MSFSRATVVNSVHNLVFPNGTVCFLADSIRELSYTEYNTENGKLPIENTWHRANYDRQRKFITIDSFLTVHGSYLYMGERAVISPLLSVFV